MLFKITKDFFLKLYIEHEIGKVPFTRTECTPATTIQLTHLYAE